MTASILARVELAPGDPILGVTEAYNADQNPNKVNLGVGVYYDDQGKVPVLECVRRVERDMLETVTPKGYLPIDGIPAYDKAVQQLAFGADAAVIKEGRAVTVQGLGGTGALKVGGRLPPPREPRRRRSGSAIRAGRTTARSSRAPGSRSTPIPTTTPRRTASTSPG